MINSAINPNEVLARYIEYRSHPQKEEGETWERLSPNSLRCYKEDISQYLGFLAEKKIPIEESSEEHFKQYLESKKYAPKTSIRKLATVSLFFGFLGRNYGSQARLNKEELSCNLSLLEKLESKQGAIISEGTYRRIVEEGSNSDDSFLSDRRSALSCILAMRAGITAKEMISLDEGEVVFSPELFSADLSRAEKAEKKKSFKPQDYEHRAASKYREAAHELKDKRSDSDKDALLINKNGVRFNSTRSLGRELEKMCASIGIFDVDLRALRRTYIFHNK